MNDNFRKGLEENNINLLRKVPKSDLHNHAGLGGRLKTLEEWAGHKIPKPPAKMETLNVMQKYIEEVLHPYITTKQGFEFSIKSAFMQAREDGVTFLEMSIDARFIALYPKREIDFVEFLKKVHQETAPEITFSPELGVMRSVDSDFVIHCARPCIETGYFTSIDLYGIEHQAPPEEFKILYKQAKKKGMKLKAHAGEFGTAESVRWAVEELELDEVQHGIAAAKSKKLMHWLRDNNIQLNICPTSNLVLGRVKSLKEHPIRTLFDNGIRVTINTDDVLLFDESVSEEYLNLYNAGVFSVEELDTIRQWGLNSHKK